MPQDFTDNWPETPGIERLMVPADVALRVRRIRETLCVSTGELLTEALDSMLREDRHPR